ncbi:MAG: flagellar hook-length control protein FliK [Lachnospiraceae bacterium]|nr:flagellar hook-length control protein FliK [Lachnospiraceae bacterium]
MSFFNFGGMNLSGQTQAAANFNVSPVSAPQPVKPEGQQPGSSGELQPGQVVSGEIMETQDDTVRIKLSGDQVINAKLESSVNIEQGQNMSFEVRTDGSQITLRPLYANLTASAATTAALDQAGLPETPQNINMVNAMMEEGMPVNRDVLREMARNVASNPTADPATIVQLRKLELPVTEQNINQLENYKNLEHQILGDAETLTDGLTELFGKTDARITGELLSLVSEEPSAFSGELKDMLSALEQLGTEKEAEASPTLLSPQNEAAKTVFSEEGAPEAEKGVLQQTVKETATQAPQQMSGPDVLPETETLKKGEVAVPSGPVLNEKPAESFEALLSDTARLLEEKGLPKEQVQTLLDGKLTPEEMLTTLGKAYEQAQKGGSSLLPLKESLEKLFASDDLKGIVRDELMKKMTLSPKEVASKEKVEELYQKLNEQSAKAMEILQHAGKADSPAFQSAQNIRENVHFINDLNQMMQYVQLPLQMAQENAHGDLYVYAKNKKQIGKDGKVSALLHLDMETLGPMDVYVAMQANRVNTHFYLQDEETLDFIMAHIDKLDERLKARGYQMHTTVTTKDIKEDRGIVDAFLQTASSEGSVRSKVSRYSFDVRA